MKVPLLLLLSGSLALLISCSPTDPTSDDSESESSFATKAQNLEPASFGGIEKLHTLEGIFLAGQPSAADLEAAGKAGLKTVINLRHDEEITDFQEGAVAKEAGLTYIHLPWNGAEELTDDVMDRARGYLRDAEKPILLHCKSANRVGALWLPYRVLDGGLTLEAALAEAKTVGLKKPEYEAKALDYIERKGS